MIEDKKRQSRWLATRSAMLDGAVATLVEHGYAGTTMQRVQVAAGVSRGSLLHHFASMQELLVAAVHRVAEGQLQELDRLVVERGGFRDVEGLVTTLYGFMSGPMFAAGLELWMASRTDAALRAELVPAEREVGQRLRTAFGEQSGSSGDLVLARTDQEGLLALLRGLAITGVLRENEDSQRAVLTNWIRRLSQ